MKNVLERNCALLLLLLSSAAAVSAAVPESLPMPHPPTLGASSSDPNVSAYDAAVKDFTLATQEYASAQAGNDPAAWQTALAAVRQNVNEIGNVIVALGAKGGTSKDDNTMNDSLRQMRDYLFQLEHDDARDAVVKAYGAAVENYQRAKDANDAAGLKASQANAAANAAAINALLAKPRYRNEEVLYSMLGYLDALQAQPDQAVRDLEKAVQFSPDDSKAHYNLGKAYEEVNPPRYADAAQQYQLVLDSLQKGGPAGQPGSNSVPNPVIGPQLTLNGVKADLATALGGAGQTDKAVALFKEMDDAGKADPSSTLSATNLENYGYLLVQSGDKPGAVLVLDRAAQLDPKNVPYATNAYSAHFALAESYETTDPNRAITEFQTASKLETDNPDLQINDPKPLYNAGVLQQKAGLDADAIASFRAANAVVAKLDPKDANTGPTHTQIQVSLGLLLAKSNSPSDLSEAALLLSQAAPALPQDAKAASVYATLGGVYARLNDPSKANAARVQALALNAHDAGSRLALADSYAAQKQPFSDAQAVEMYQQSLADLAAQTPPASAALQANVQNQIGVLYQRLGQYKKAQEAFQQALKLNPSLAAAQNNLGVTYEKQGKLAEARVAYQAAHRLDGSLLEASYNLNRPLGGSSASAAEDAYSLNESGTAYFTLKRYAKALAAFRSASKLDPKSAQIWNNLGATYQEMGSPAAAHAALKKALTLDPSLSVARQNLSDANGHPRLVTYEHRARP